MSEVVDFEGLVGEIPTPECTIGWDGCQGDAVVAIRVHDCAFHYGCAHCGKQMLRNFEEGMQYPCRICGGCRKAFTHEDFFTTTHL